MLSLNSKEAFVRHDMRPIWELQDELSASHFRPYGVYVEAGLFSELPDGRLLKRFPLFEAAARRGPVGLTCQSPSLVGEAKRQHSSSRIEDEQSG
jgi:hypothetical protein